MDYDEALSSDQLPIKVRPIGKEELEEALSLIHQSIRVLNAKDYKPTQIEAVIQTYKISTLVGKGVIVAELNDRLVGVAKMSLFTSTIDAVFTHPQFVRQGVGRALVEEIERRARLQNKQQLSIMASITGVEFYETLGYKNYGELKGEIPCVCMGKEFRPVTIGEQIVGFCGFLLLVGIVIGIAILLTMPVILLFTAP